MKKTSKLARMLGGKPTWWFAVLALVFAPASLALAHDYDEEEKNDEDPDTAQALYEEEEEEEAEEPGFEEREERPFEEREEHDEEREEHGFEEHEEHGYDSAKEAAEAFMTSIEERDVEKMKSTVPPEEREEFERIGETLMESIELREYEIVSIDEEEDRATVTYTWDVEIDKDKVVEGYTEVIRESLRDEGLTEEEIEQILAVEMEPLQQDLHAQMEDLEREENRMTLEKIDGRWYVTSPVDEDHELKSPEEMEEDVEDDELEEEEYGDEVEEEEEEELEEERY